VEGNRVASKSLIMGVAAIDLGSPLTPAQTSEAIRRLYGLDIFSNVSIEAEEVTGGIKVFLVVKELPKLTGLEFDGNKKVDDQDLKDDLLLGVGGYISEHLIAKKKKEIKDIYGKKGYFQAEITHSLNYNTDSTEAVLTYMIDEKSKVKVEHVYLEGNERVPDNDIIGKMRNRKRGFLKSSDFAQDKYDEDMEKIIDEFHKKGYIDAYLISDSMTIDSITNRMSIYLNVHEGPLYYFGKTEFVDIKEMPEKYLRKKIKFKENQVFDKEKYDKSLEEIYSAYYDIGHLHIRLADERTTRNDTIIDVTYRIAEGLPSHINLVKIVGNGKTKDHVIRREISALPGQKFNRELLIRSVRDVMALNFFSNVNPVPLNLPNGDVDVEFEIEEKQTGQVSAGAGYNSQDKVVGNVGLGIPNFRGMGQNVSFNTDFGSRRNSVSLSFTEPWLFGHPTLLGTDLYSTNRRWFNDYIEARQGASLRVGKRLRWPDNYFRIFTSYRLERDKYHDFDDTFINQNSYKSYHRYPATDTLGQPIIDELTNDFIYIYDPDSTYNRYAPYPGSILEFDNLWHAASRFSINITRDSRNLPEFATSGSKISYTFEKTGGIIGGYWNYTKHSISVAKFIPIIGNLAIAAKVQFGGITSPKNSNDKYTLLSGRFTPGGTAYDGIVRGYDDGMLTPDSLISQSDTSYYYYSKDSAIAGTDPIDTRFSQPFTTRVRGNYMLVTNIELQFPIIKQQAYVLAFFDAGNSWLRAKDIAPWSDDKRFLYKSVGLGFRIVIPMMGTLGFDFGYALDELRGREPGWKTHFQMGTTFR
ncbi:outer membrane protein assembly factor BamA, partial [Candidatus Zixiibacteriota bacterium]